MYRTQLESMLVQHVFPEFKNPLGYLRARVGKEIRNIATRDYNEFTVCYFQEVTLSHGV